MTSSLILESLEARWFVSPDDATTRELESLFEHVTAQPRRVDFYAPTGRDDLGVKARTTDAAPSKLETKYRQAQLGPKPLVPGVEANLERWNKISLEVTHESRRSIETSWRRIEKVRRLRKFAFEAGGVRPIDTGEQVPVGCGAELTRLSFKIGDGMEVAWTFGFEAFGNHSSESEDALFATAHFLFGEAAPFTLEAGTSRGYPAWLAERFW